MKELELSTLDHKVKFNGHTFKVGCQTISYDDMQELAKFIQEQDKPKEDYFSTGDLITIEGRKYLIALVGYNRVCVTSISGQFHYGGIREVTHSSKITRKELDIGENVKKVDK